MLDFIIAGVQRGGTTALHFYLSQHLEIFLPERKELHFFDDEAIDWSAPDYTRLHRHFTGRKDSQIAGEATPIYIFKHSCIERIHRYNPAIRLITLLRDPVERAYSQWSMRVKNRGERRSFSEAIRCPSAPGTRYIDRGLYAEQIAQVQAAFPAAQLLFFRSEDLRDEHADTLDRVCRFLGVASFKAHPEPAIVNLASGGGLPNMSADDRALLSGIFRDDTGRTQALTGLDLSAWSPLQPKLH